jgi:hypothetical protein
MVAETAEAAGIDPALAEPVFQETKRFLIFAKSPIRRYACMGNLNNPLGQKHGLLLALAA